ncbi:MAG: hypothetical protein WCI55_09340 [Armatimonadota bacterium]
MNARLKQYRIGFCTLGLLALQVVCMAQGATTGKDNNPANSANWELVSSQSGTASYVTYPNLFTTPVTGSYSLANPPNPLILSISTWSIYTGVWTLSGQQNLRWKWIGIGGSPTNVRVWNSGKNRGSFVGPHTFSYTLTGVDNIAEYSDSTESIKTAGGYKTVDADTLFQVGFTQNATVMTSLLGSTGSGSFEWSGGSELKELSSALRRANGTTYHKVGNGPTKEENIGGTYSDWIMDTVARDGGVDTPITISNLLTGPWNNLTATYLWTAEGNFQNSTNEESLESKTVRYAYSKQQWHDLSTAPDEKLVTVSVKNVSSSDQPERVGKIHIRIHNPFENWRKLLWANGNPHETLYDKEPMYKEYYPDHPTSTIAYSTSTIKFKGYFSFPTVVHVTDALNSKLSLVNALLDVGPAKFKTFMNAAQVTMSEVLAPETGTGPYEADYASQWTNPKSVFDPPGLSYTAYVMTASVKFPFKLTMWKADGYDETGYTGVVPGETDVYNGGGYVYGYYKAGPGGGLPGGGPPPPGG